MAEPSIGPEEEVTYESLIERAKREGGEAIARFKARLLAPREKVEKWRDEAARGERARAFLNGEFWKKDLGPMLRGEARVKPCQPDSVPKSIEAAATEYLYKSGAAWLAEVIDKTIRNWISDGDKAKAELSTEMERRKAAQRK